MAWWRTDAIEVGRTVRVLVKHTIYIVVALGCMWVIENAIMLIWHGESEPRVFDQFPLRYVFQAADLAIVGAFYYYALGEIREIHKRGSGR
jgi:hypothetical protein